MGPQDDMERRTSHIDLSGKIHQIELSISQGFSEMKTQHIMFNKDLGNLSTQQNKIVDCLYGNGHEGLVTKVAKISQRMAIMWTVFWGIGVVCISILGYFIKGLADKIM